jgi:hypothetical protein
MRHGGAQYAQAQRDDPSTGRRTTSIRPGRRRPARCSASSDSTADLGTGLRRRRHVEGARGGRHEVISTDLIDRGYGEGGRDFLMEWQPLAPNIVTNPPFRWAVEFVDRALMLTTGKVALFLRLAFLEGQERGRWFPTTPLARSGSCRAGCRSSAGAWPRARKRAAASSPSPGSSGSTARRPAGARLARLGP